MIIFEILKRGILAVISFVVSLLLLYLEIAVCASFLFLLLHLPPGGGAMPTTAAEWTAIGNQSTFGKLGIFVSFLLAAVGALIFALSCFSKFLSYTLFSFRKWLTTFIVFGYSFVLVFIVAVYLISAIVGAVMGANMGANITTSDPQQRQQAFNAIPVAVREYEMRHTVGIIGASAFVALLMAWMITSYLVLSERLPWCRLSSLDRSPKKHAPPPPASTMARKIEPKPAQPPPVPVALTRNSSPASQTPSAPKPVGVKAARNPVKDTLFGNLALDQWPAPVGDITAFPWSTFDEARNHLQAGQVPEAIVCWQAIVATPSLESLHYMQAWHFLRQNGVQPLEEEAKTVYGVIGEQGASGVLTAVFIDGQARVYSDQGQGMAWLHPDASLDPLIELILLAATQLVLKMKQSDPRLSLSASSTNSISILTPSGIYLKTGAPNSFESTPLIKPIADGFGQIITALMEKAKR